MNYQKIYDSLIEISKARGLDKKKLEGYFEKHHIIPKCLGGDNSKSNLVLLTGREHCLCHYLLWKTNKNSRALFYAHYRMVNPKRYIKFSSKQYEQFKYESLRLGISDEHRMKLMLANTGKIKTAETCAKMSKSMIGKTASSETKKKLSDMKIGVLHSDEWNANVSKAMTGKKRGSYKIKSKASGI